MGILSTQYSPHGALSRNFEVILASILDQIERVLSYRIFGRVPSHKICKSKQMKNRRVFLFVSLMLLLAASANPLFAQPSEADDVRDHYPKNPGIDVLNYTFELQLLKA